MGIETAVSNIRAFFSTAWGVTTQIAWDDVPFVPPSGATWVRLNISHTDGYQASIGALGNNKQRRIGRVIVQVFAPSGEASKDARIKADLAVTAFLSQSTNGILFLDTYASEIGDDGHGWYQINVYSTFQYDIGG